MNKNLYTPTRKENSQMNETFGSLDESQKNLILMSDKTQHIFHHGENISARVNMKIEKNSRGYNYSVTVEGASSVDEALELLKDAQTKLETEYGENNG